MLFNISQLRNHITCPQLAHNQYVVRRLPANLRPGVSTGVGTLFHLAAQHRLSRGSVPTDAELLVSAGSGAIWEAWSKFKLRLPLEAWQIPSDWKILGVELPLQTDLAPNLTLQGRLDALVEVDGKLWSLQWKTYADDLASLIERVQIGWHECYAYPTLVASMGIKLPYAGTILGACRKLPSYRLRDTGTGKKVRVDVTDADRIEAFTFHWLALNPTLYSQRAKDVLKYAEDMRLTTDFPHNEPKRNPDACHGYFGNSRCPYWSSCYDGEDINGPGFVPILDRYADLSPDNL